MASYLGYKKSVLKNPSALFLGEELFSFIGEKICRKLRKILIYSRYPLYQKWRKLYKCLTSTDLYQGMVKDAMPKRVPCPIHRPEDPRSLGKVSLRHRQILIEWLLEVASEEKFRRFKIFSDRFFSETIIP